MKKTDELSLTKLADAAFKQAARRVIELARQTGTPLIVWKNDAILELEPPPIKPKKSRSRRVE